MTRTEFALLMDNRQYPLKITKEEEVMAKENNLLVVFGASDDLCELRGAIHDELGAYKECMFFVGKGGKLQREIEDDDFDILQKYDAVALVLKSREDSIKIKSRFDIPEEPLYSWTYETSAPHSVFDILGDGDRYCRGIVIDLKECGLI